jgi:sigma-E factor negative regulatory protein RseC
MRTIGNVVSVSENSAQVVLGVHTECRHCGACAAGLEDRQRTVEAANAIRAAVGQRVEVEIEPAHAVGAALLIFIMPLVVALAGGLGGYRLAAYLGLRADVCGIGLGVVAFIAVFVLLRHIDRLRSGALIARIVRLVPDEDLPEGGGRNSF